MIKLDIVVHPTFSEPEIHKEEEKKPTGKKWRFPWRINMLSRAKPPAAKKYEPPPPEVFKVFGPVDPDTAFRADHVARPRVRLLAENRRRYHDRGQKYVTTISNTLNKSWDSIYNYYRKKLRERRLKRLKRKIDKLKAKKPTGKKMEEMENKRKELLGKLATPKKLFLPEKIPRKRKALEDLAPIIDVLAAPKERHIVPPREIGKVSSKALLYEITEQILKLSQLPESKRKRLSDGHPPGWVKPAALHAICTPRIEKLAMPSFSAREAKKHDEDKYDPWAISPTALKYKPSARILELAKPLERE